MRATVLLVASAVAGGLGQPLRPRHNPLVPAAAAASDPPPTPMLLRVQADDNYTFAFRGGHNHTTGQRFDFTSGTQLASRGFNGSFSASDALAGCEALCSSDPCCVGLTLTDGAGGAHGCHTVNSTASVETYLPGVSYSRPEAPGCQRAPLARPAPIRLPIRGWSISCDLDAANRSALYPGVNLLTEGAPATALGQLAQNDVAVLARRDVEAPFAPGAPCRGFNTSAGRASCIDLLAEQFRTNDTASRSLWSGVGLDEWTLANWTGVPGSGVPWPHGSAGPVANAAETLKEGYREGRRRYPKSVAAAWVAEGVDDAFGELMRDGTFSFAMVEGYTVCWLPAHCWSTIDDQFPFLHWARSQGWINRTMFTFGWMVPQSAQHPNGWTVPHLEASMRRLKATFPEMPGVLMWGSAQHRANESGCGNATLGFIRAASELMLELWPDAPGAGGW